MGISAKHSSISAKIWVCVTVVPGASAHGVTFGEKGPDLLPVCGVVVEYDPVLVHANALQSELAPKSRHVVPVLHHMEHT